jgi:superfamily II DNA or RNA helicase
MAEVDWGSGGAEFVDVEFLEPKELGVPQNAAECVRSRRYGTLDDLRRRMTFEKLRGNLTDIVYSMKTAEIDFYPHQFKPALRFIESASNRLLIADEVGLGKTIEAGLIWTEWQARARSRRLLVVCTPNLVPKWIAELRDKFQINAEETDVEGLSDHFDRFDRRGPGAGFVLVGSYHGLRPRFEERELLDKMSRDGGMDAIARHELTRRTRLLQRIREQGDAATQSGGAHFLDMVVFDEAHWMKNTASASFHLGEILSAAADAALCLSATPIHNQSRDLYALLRLIDPEVFRDEAGFDQLRNRNQPFVELHRALSRPGWSVESIRPWVGQLPLPERDRVEQSLATIDGSPAGRADFRYQVEQMNLLSAFINRTRKLDVILDKVVRVPVTIPLSLSEPETAFYNMVLEAVRAAVRREGKQTSSFHLIHPALSMSSSIPVVAEAVRAGKWGGFEDMALLADDVGDDWEDDRLDWLNSATVETLAAYDFETNDSKYEKLRESLRHIARGGSLTADSGKVVTLSETEPVIIFAFFKATVRYLARRLRADGFSCAMLTGDIKPGEERTKIIEEFRSGLSRVLLCSEVAAEGIDLQHARVIVNYDLPWNPMRVEQRIGRIDRIGQKANSVVIVNFHVRGTIDGSIYAHLYNKIGIFENSIGALEGILGAEVSKLTAAIFSQNLTPEQLAARVEASAQAVCQRAIDERKLEENTGALIAFEDLLSERIGESQRLGRYVRPDELRLHVTDFLRRSYQGDGACLVIPDSPLPGCMELTLGLVAASDFDSYCKAQELAPPVGFAWQGKPVKLTFDPAVFHSARAAHRSLQLVNHLHPLMRWITDSDRDRTNEWYKVSAVSLESSDHPPGEYFYLVHRLLFEGVTRREAFTYVAKHLGSGTILTGIEAERLTGNVLERGESLLPREMPDLSDSLAELKRVMTRELVRQQAAFNADQDIKLDLRRRQIEGHFDRRIEAQRRRIESFQMTGASEAKLSGFRKTLSNLIALRTEQLRKLNDKLALRRQTFAEVACGYLVVTAKS